VNGDSRPVLRVRIEFHGGLFRRAADLGSLTPEDCFVPATYKNHPARRGQEDEHLPYVFVVVGARALAADVVERSVFEALALLRTSIAEGESGTPERDVEDAMVCTLRDRPGDFGVAGQVPRDFEAIRSAPGYALPARGADSIVCDELFERVFALRVPRFARNYRNAELDAHFRPEAVS
jgi:hypothetical protein